MTSLCATKQNDGLLEKEKEKDGSDPPHKKRRIFLKSPKNCHFQYRSKEEMETILKLYVPQNTEKTLDGHGSALLIGFLKEIQYLMKMTSALKAFWKCNLQKF